MVDPNKELSIAMILLMLPVSNPRIYRASEISLGALLGSAFWNWMYVNQALSEKQG